MDIQLLVKYWPLILGCSRPCSRVFMRTAVDLAYKIHGNVSPDRIPVITIHGLLGTKKNWESMSKKIASSLQTSVIAVDLRNHGESPHDNSHTYFDLATDMSQLISKLSIEKSDIIGHSMGGRTAMVLALSEPSKVSRLVIVDISPITTPSVLNDFFPRLLDVMKTIKFDDIKSNVAEARKVAKDKLVASGIVGPNDNTNFITMNIAMRPNNVIGWNCNVDVLKQYYASITTFPNEMKGKTFTGPALFIAGDRSDFLPPEDINGIRSYFPKAELKQSDLISSLIVVDISPVRTSPQISSMVNLFDAMSSVSIRAGIAMSKARKLADEQLKSITPDINLRNFLITNLVQTNTGAYTWRVNLPALKDNFQHHICCFPSNLKGLQYCGPTLFVGGSLSDYIGKNDLHEIQEFFPLAELMFIEGAGHWVHSQKPEKFLETVCKFLTEK